MKKGSSYRFAAWVCACMIVVGSLAGGTEKAYGAGPGEQYGPAFAGLSGDSGELKGVWIPYLIWNQLPKEKTAFQKAVDEMFDNCSSWGMNAVFVHVRSHGDAMYPSSVFPWSKFAGKRQGKSPGYDPLAYMIESAHARGLKFHAWINPYRVTGYLMPWEEVSADSPAKRWLTDTETFNDRYVLKHDNAYYYNPSVEEVKRLVVNGVLEIVKNYEIDGIHFDDYFYPEINDELEEYWFDRPEYLASGSKETIVQWRRNHVSDLVSRVYQTVKAEKPQVLFGISPQGYVEHLRSETGLFVDIDRWMSQAGYVDYIMPQLYWGFETKTAAGEPAPYAYEQNLATWLNLKKKGPVTLYLGLGLFRAGTDVKDYNEVSEWLRRDDVIGRQVSVGRQKGEVKGYCFYSYDSFLQPEAQKEVANLLPLLK